MIRFTYVMENIGIASSFLTSLDIKAQFFTIKVLEIDDEGLGPCN